MYFLGFIFNSKKLKCYDTQESMIFGQWAVLEKLYKARWGLEDGVGSIIMAPTRELANQLFGVLKSIGKHHGFSAGLLIGGHEYDEE
ncbi:putative RNA helicase [Helianthus anomalus]